MVDVDASRAEEMQLAEISGVLVDRVVRGGAADRSGVRRNDIILAINGDPVAATNQLQSRIATHRPGETVDLDVWRDGEMRSVRVSLVDREDQAMRAWIAQLNEPVDPEADDSESEDLPTPQLEEAVEWGIGLRDLTATDQSDFGVEAGAYIAYVRGGSSAYEGGLPRDAVVTEINGRAVAGLTEVLEVLEAEVNMAELERDAGGVESASNSVLIRVQRRSGFSAFYEVSVPLGSP
jgi:S1-C subfamily serine protease